jgi:hypothetical protein
VSLNLQKIRGLPSCKDNSEVVFLLRMYSSRRNAHGHIGTVEIEVEVDPLKPAKILGMPICKEGFDCGQVTFSRRANHTEEIPHIRDTHEYVGLWR